MLYFSWFCTINRAATFNPLFYGKIFRARLEKPGLILNIVFKIMLLSISIQIFCNLSKVEIWSIYSANYCIFPLLTRYSGIILTGTIVQLVHLLITSANLFNIIVWFLRIPYYGSAWTQFFAVNHKKWLLILSASYFKYYLQSHTVNRIS